MNNNEVELELIIYGDVQGVGYRQYVKRVARKLNIKGHAKNLEDDTVEIRCKGEIDNINSFKDKIIVKNPLDVPLIEVDEIISENILPEGTIKEKTFRVIAGNINDELLESNVTGINYLNLFRKETGNKIDNLGVSLGDKIDNLGVNLGNKMDNGFDSLGRKIDNGFDSLSSKIDNLDVNLGNKIDNGFSKMDDNFANMDEKYKLISEGMFAIVNELKETNKVLGEKLEKTEKNIEKTDKNIEELLKLLVQQNRK